MKAAARHAKALQNEEFRVSLARELADEQGELACAGLLDLAFRSSSAAAKPDPKTVTVTAMAFSFFVGRVNAAQPRATPAEIKAAAAKLTPEERNAYGNLCLKKAGEVMSPLMR